MSISGVSSASVSQLPQQDSQRQSLLALTKAIDSGDLSGAQQAYSALTNSQNGSAPDPNSPLGQALSQIGQDLQSGDIGGAQQTLTTLRQSHGHHRHHHAAAPTDTSSQTQTSAPTSTSSSTNLLDIKA